MTNKLCADDSAAGACRFVAVALFMCLMTIIPPVTAESVNDNTQSNFDVRKNYSGNPNAVAFSDSGSRNDGASRQDGLSPAGGASPTDSPDTKLADYNDEQLPPAKILAEKESVADLASKKEALRKKTLANYSDVADNSDEFALPAVKQAKPVEKVVVKEDSKTEPEKQTQEVSKAVPTSVKKEEVKIIRTDVKKIVSEPDDSPKAVVVTDSKSDKVSGDAEATAQQTEAVAKAASKDPACTNAELEAGRARTATTQADKLFYLRRASRLCPNFAGYHVEIGQVYAALNRKEDARFSYNKALEIEPDNVEAKKLINGLK